MAHIEKRRRRLSDGTLGPTRYRARVRGPEGERSKTFASLTEARAWAAAEANKVHQGDWVDPRSGRRTFGEYAREWQTLQTRHRASTAAKVESNLRNHILPFFDDQPIGLIRPSAIKSWVKDRSAAMSPSTLEVVYSYLVAIFKTAVDDRVISSSPCPLPKRVLPRPPKHEVSPPTTAEVEAILVALPARYRAIAIVAAGAGLRSGEILGLTKPKFDALRRQLIVDQQLLMPSKGAAYIGQPKTDASYRTVPIPQAVVDALAAHIAAFPSEPVTLLSNASGKDETKAHEFLFTNEKGQPIRRNRLNEIWRAAVAAATVEKSGETVSVADGIGLHDLRHYYASLLIHAGCSVKTVQKRLGHSSAAETLDTYAHLWDDDEDRTRDAVQAVLGEVLNGTAERAAVGRS